MGSNFSKTARDATGTKAPSTKPGAMARQHVLGSEMGDIKSKDIISASAREAVAPPLVEGSEMADIEAWDAIDAATGDGFCKLLAQLQAIKNDLELFEINAKGSIDSGAIDGVNELNARALKIMSDLESVGIYEQNGITSIAEDVRQELEANFISIKEAFERVGTDERDGITSIAEDVRRELDAKFISIKEALERVRIKAIYSINVATESGVRKIELVTEENMRKIDTLNEKEYELKRDEMLRVMMKHYAKTLSQVTTSPLNDWVQAPLADIYMPSNLQLMKKDKGSFIKSGTQITEYRNVFLTDGEQSRHTFIQGEAGSGKSTFLAKLIMDWCSAMTTKLVEALPTAETNSADRDSRIKRGHFFKDFTSLKSYMFIFHVTLRESVLEFEIFEMIKHQIIDSIYSKEDRDNAYKLLIQIMKRERCLVLLDGLDEWNGTGGHNLPTLAVSLSQCDMLITTRPWKMSQSKILDSKIDRLLQLEGVNEPFDVSKRLLACRGEYKESKALDNKHSEFKSYVFKNDLYELLVSPMLLSLIVQSWSEGTELKGSRCEIYSLLLESLLKKANSETSEFQTPPFRCFTWTQYIKPNNEHVDRLAEAAFYLFFSDKRENSLVFSITDLKNSNSKLHEQERLDFALKSGILSATRKGSILRSSLAFSFIHKSLQEFLAANHIARNTHLNLIDDVISGYLHRQKDAYLDISQVFIFLCGLDILGANKLSGIMDEHNNARVKSGFDNNLCGIILTGYREAVANAQTKIALTLSHIHCANYNMRDAHSVWQNNTFNMLSLSLDINLRDRDSHVPGRECSPATTEPLSHIEFKLSSCPMIDSLNVVGNGIWLKDNAFWVRIDHNTEAYGYQISNTWHRGTSSRTIFTSLVNQESDSAAGSEQPVWIVLDSANPAQCTDPPLVLPSIKHISLIDVTCSPAGLHSLFSTLLTLDHEVKCALMRCDISSRVEGALSRFCLFAAITTDVNNTFSLHLESDHCPGLWEALHGQSIKCLSLSGLNAKLKNQNAESLLKSVQSLPQLETLNIKVNVNAYISPNLWETLNSLNIKRVILIINSVWCGLIVHNASMLSQALLSNNTETICMYLNAQPCKIEAMHGLPIESLSLFGSGESLDIIHVSSLYKMLSSLKQLKNVGVFVNNENPGLWEAFHGLNIKCLSLTNRDLRVNHVSSFSQLLSSLAQLEMLNVKVNFDSPGFLDALHGLNIKSLSLNGLRGGLTGWMKELAVQQMKPLSRLFKSLRQLDTLSIGVEDDCSGLSDALHGLYIKSLSLSGGSGSLNVNHAELLSQSISSLTQLETLTLHVFTYMDLQLPQSLKYFNFYCTGISPPQLRDLLKVLSACTQTVKSKLELGCALCTNEGFLLGQEDPIPPEEYIPIQQELTVQRNVAVKRFRILDRIRDNRWYESADSAWSVRDNVAVEHDDYDDGIADDETYNLFVQHLGSDNRISIRLKSYVASTS